MDKFADRREAGEVLARQLEHYQHRVDTIVLALPRGGVPVGYEIAKALSLPLDVLIVRKLGAPNHEELAMGAIAAGGVFVLNDSIIKDLHITDETIQKVITSEQQELKRRDVCYRGHRSLPVLTGKTIILVDDGIATGATIRAAIQTIQAQKPARIVVAVPVAARSTCNALAQQVDELICPLKPLDFHAVGLWYDNFPQTTDDEVRAFLKD